MRTLRLCQAHLDDPSISISNPLSNHTCKVLLPCQVTYLQFWGSEWGHLWGPLSGGLLSYLILKHKTLKHETCPQRPKGAEAHRACTLCGPGKVNTAVVVGTTLRSPCQMESSGPLGSTLLAGRALSPGLLRINGPQALKQDGEEPQASPARLPTAEQTQPW